MALVTRPPDRRRRNSAFRPSTNGVVSTLREMIRRCEGTDVTFTPPNPYGLVEFTLDLVPLRKGLSKRVRRVNITGHRYKVGWVVDADFAHCMLCLSEFGWVRGRPKHHCRTCGALVCHDCSPYLVSLPILDEERGSRVCRNCFGLKPGLLSPWSAATTSSSSSPALPSPLPGQSISSAYTLRREKERERETSPGAYYDAVVSTSVFSPPLNAVSHSHSHTQSGSQRYTPYTQHNTQRNPATYSHNTNTQRTQPTQAPHTPHNNNNPLNGKVHRRTRLTPRREAEDSLIRKYIEEMEKFEREQQPKYDEAFRKMRELIPLDIHKSSLRGLVVQGIPEDTAARLWNTRILWLIVTHKNDIAKMHLADFRSKYHFDGLDIVEMRAIWHVLPRWDGESANPLERGKFEWREGFKSKLDDLVYKETRGTLAAHLQRNPVYEDADELHLFDPEEFVFERFHRSASFRQDALESPMTMNNGRDGEEDEENEEDERDNVWGERDKGSGRGREREKEEEDPYSLSPLLKASPVPGGQTTNSSRGTNKSQKSQKEVPLSVRSRRAAYLDNFASPDSAGEREKRERRFRTLLDEVQQEAEEEEENSEEEQQNGSGSERETKRQRERDIFDDDVSSLENGSESSLSVSISLAAQHTTLSTQLEAQTPFPSHTLSHSHSVSERERERERNGVNKVRFASHNAVTQPSPASPHTPHNAVSQSAQTTVSSDSSVGSTQPALTTPSPPHTTHTTQPALTTSTQEITPRTAYLSRRALTTSSSLSENVLSQRILKPTQRALTTDPSVSVPTTATHTVSSPPHNTLSQRASFGSYRDDMSLSLSQRSLTTPASPSHNAPTQFAQSLPQSALSPSLSRSARLERERETLRDRERDRETPHNAASQRALRVRPVAFPSLTPRAHNTPSFSQRTQHVPIHHTTPVHKYAENVLSPFSVESLQSTSGTFFNTNGTFSAQAHQRTNRDGSGGTFSNADGTFFTPRTDYTTVSATQPAHTMPLSPLSVSLSERDTQRERESLRRVLTEDCESELCEEDVSVLTPLSLSPSLSVESLSLSDKHHTTRSHNTHSGHSDNPRPLSLSSHTTLSHNTARLSHTATTHTQREREMERESERESESLVSVGLSDNLSPNTTEAEKEVPTQRALTTHTADHSHLFKRRLSHKPLSQDSQPSQTQTQTPHSHTTLSHNERVRLCDALSEGDLAYCERALCGVSVTSVLSAEELAHTYWRCARRLCERDRETESVTERVTERETERERLRAALLYLLDNGAVSVSLTETHTGETLLHKAVRCHDEPLGRALIRRNADLLVLDNQSQCPLSICLSEEETDWVVDEFESAGCEIKLLALGSSERKKRYVACFVLSGQSDKAREILASGRVRVSAEEATQWLRECQGNFESMTDPVDTFELLSSLGADL